MNFSSLLVDNTWFKSSLTLNRSNILESIGAKTTDEYKAENEFKKHLARAKTAQWPFATEYIDKFELNAETQTK
jgi:hypothetical protein